MKLFTIVVLIFLSTKLMAQDPLYVDSLYFTSRLKSITKLSSLVIAYRHYSYWNQATPWQILTIGPKRIVTKYNTNSSFGNLKKLEINQDSLKKELDLFYQYDIFSMKSTRDWFATCDSCKIMIYDGDEYSFLILTNTEFFHLYFYEPAYHVTCCKRLFGYEKIIDLIRGLFAK